MAFNYGGGEIPIVGGGGLASVATNSAVAQAIDTTQVWSSIGKIPPAPPALTSSGAADGVVRLRVRVPLADAGATDTVKFYQLDTEATVTPPVRSVSELDYVIVAPPNNFDGAYDADVANVLDTPSSAAEGYIPVLEYTAAGGTVVRVPSKDRWRVNQGLDRIEFYQAPLPPSDATGFTVTYFEYTGPTAASNTGEAPKNAVFVRSVDLRGEAIATGLVSDVTSNGAQGLGKKLRPVLAGTTPQPSLTIEGEALTVGRRVLVDNNMNGAAIGGGPPISTVGGGADATAGSIDNGIYVFGVEDDDSWSLTRTPGFDNDPSGNEAVVGCYTFVTDGSLYALQGYYVRFFQKPAGGAGEIDVDTIVWALMTGGSGTGPITNVTSITNSISELNIRTLNNNDPINIEPNGSGDINLISANGTGAVVIRGNDGNGSNITTATTAGGETDPTLGDPNLNIFPAPGGDLSLSVEEAPTTADTGTPVGGNITLTATGETDATTNAGNGGNVTIAAVGSNDGASGGTGGDLSLSATAGGAGGGTALLTSDGGTTVSATGLTAVLDLTSGAGGTTISSTGGAIDVDGDSVTIDSAMGAVDITGANGATLTATAGDVATTGKNVTLTATATTADGDAADGTVTAAHPAGGAFVVDQTGAAGTATITSASDDDLLVAAADGNDTTVRATGAGAATLETTGAGDAIVKTADVAANVVIDSANLVDIDGANGIDLTTSAGNVDISAFADFTASGVNSTITATTGSVTLQHPDAGSVFVENTGSDEARISPVAGQDLLIAAAANRTATVSAGDVFITSTGTTTSPFNHVNLEHPTGGTVTIRNTDTGVNTARLTSDTQDNLYIYAAAGRTLTLGRNNATATDVTTINGYNINLTPTVDTNVNITATGTGNVILSGVDSPGFLGDGTTPNGPTPATGVIEIEGALRINKYGFNHTSNPEQNTNLVDGAEYLYLYARQRDPGGPVKLYIKDDNATFEIPAAPAGTISTVFEAVTGPPSQIRPLPGLGDYSFCVGDIIQLEAVGGTLLANTNSMFYDHATHSLRVGGAGTGTAWDTRADYGLVGGFANEVSGVTDGTTTFTADYSAAVGQGNAITGIVSTDGTSAAAAATHGFASGQGNAITGQATLTTATAAVYGFAHGNGNAVTAPYGVAFGQGTAAGGSHSFAHGNGAAAGAQYSFAFGDANTVSNGTASFAHGLNCDATMPGAFAHGNDVDATANYAFANGDNVSATADYSFAHGLRVTASAVGAFAMGTGDATAAGTQATGVHSFAFGKGAETTRVTASGDYSFAFGDASAADVTASGDYSFAFGLGATATATGAVSIGDGDAQSSYSGAIAGQNPRVAGTNATRSVVLGGLDGQITGTNPDSVILGGTAADILGNGAQSAIVGGNNAQMTDCINSVILGGVGNVMTTSSGSFIVGGNTSGGNNNVITNSLGAMAMGNNVQITDAPYAFGGGNNVRITGDLTDLDGSTPEVQPTTDLAGCFLWNCGDGSEMVNATAAGEFRIRAPGGFKVHGTNGGFVEHLNFGASTGLILNKVGDNASVYTMGPGDDKGRLFVIGSSGDLYYQAGTTVSPIQLNAASVFAAADNNITAADAATNINFAVGTGLTLAANITDCAILGSAQVTINATASKCAIVGAGGPSDSTTSIGNTAGGCVILGAENATGSNITVSGAAKACAIVGASFDNTITAGTASGIFASRGSNSNANAISGGGVAAAILACRENSSITSSGSANSIISAFTTTSGGDSHVISSTGNANTILACEGSSAITGTAGSCAIIAASGDHTIQDTSYSVVIGSRGDSSAIGSSSVSNNYGNSIISCDGDGVVAGYELKIDGEETQFSSIIASGTASAGAPVSGFIAPRIHEHVRRSVLAGTSGCRLGDSLGSGFAFTTECAVLASRLCYISPPDDGGLLQSIRTSGILASESCRIRSVSAINGPSTASAIIASKSCFTDNASNSVLIAAATDCEITGNCTNTVVMGKNIHLDAAFTNNLFVWSNGNGATTGGTLTPKETESFEVFVSGGTAAFYDSVNDNSVIAGQKLSGGFWVSACDRAKKENIEELDYEVAISNLEQLPLYSYNYLTTDPDKNRHYGPVAQEWHPLFPSTGIDELQVAAMDVAGVALAAVRGVAARERAGRIAAEARLDAAEAALAALAARVEALEGART